MEDEEELLGSCREEEKDEDMEENDSETNDASAKSMCISVMSVVRPVCLCLFLVLFARWLFTDNDSGTFGALPYSEEESDSGETKLEGSLLNALIFLVVFFIAAVLLCILYKKRYYTAIRSYMGFAIFIMFFLIGGQWIYLLFYTFHWPLPLPMYLFLTTNLAAGSIIALLYYSSSSTQRAFLLIAGTLAAWWLSHLPMWTSWAILGAVVIFDIAAVLAPHGPLREVVEESRTRDEPLPAPAYQGEGLTLGLGDFVFYGLLTVRAADIGGPPSALAAALAILGGLGCTLVILALTGKPMPALPLAIIFGTVATFSTTYSLVRLVSYLISQGVLLV